MCVCVCPLARPSGEGGSALDGETLLAGLRVQVVTRALGQPAAGGWFPEPLPRACAPWSALPAASAPARRRRFLPPPPALAPGDPAMPVRTECPPPAGASATSAASLIPPPPINTQQPGVATSLLYSGSKFRGHQKSKGNSYDVEVVLQVSAGRPGRARGPPRGALGPGLPWAPRALSRGPGPRSWGLLHPAPPTGTCPADVTLSNPSPNPPLDSKPVAARPRRLSHTWSL